jgi:hypothetical protein
MRKEKFFVHKNTKRISGERIKSSKRFSSVCVREWGGWEIATDMIELKKNEKDGKGY